MQGTSAEGTKRGGYRASDAEPEPEKPSGLEDLEPMDAKPAPEPVAKPGPKAAPTKPAAEPVRAEPAKPAPTVAASPDEKDPLLDEEREPTVLPAPPPTRKPTTSTTKAPARETKPPEPKKDISEWDPNGD